MFNIIVYGKRDYMTLGIPPSSPNINHARYVRDWKEHIDNNEFFKFTNFKKIQPNTKYVVYLNHYQQFVSDTYQPVYKFYPCGEESNDLLDNVAMSERIWEDSKNGLVHWLIDWGTECTQLEHNSGIDFEKLCVALNTVPKNITLITGAETNDPYGTLTVNTAIKHGYNCVTSYELFKFFGNYYSNN